MTLENVETQIWSTLQDKMLMFNSEFHAQINALKGQVSARFNDIHAPNLGKIWEEVAIL